MYAARQVHTALQCFHCFFSLHPPLIQPLPTSSMGNNSNMIHYVHSSERPVCSGISQKISITGRNVVMGKWWKY